MSTTVDPPPEQLASLTARPAHSPVLMVNLLKFRQPDGLSASVAGYETSGSPANVGAGQQHVGASSAGASPRPV